MAQQQKRKDRSPMKKAAIERKSLCSVVKEYEIILRMQQIKMFPERKGKIPTTEKRICFANNIRALSCYCIKEKRHLYDAIRTNLEVFTHPGDGSFSYLKRV